MSERFLKKRLPISRIAGIISLILQIIITIAIALSVAQPVFILKDSANDYLFILDSSASMNMEQDGTTRFSVAKKEIENLITTSANGSTYTLICADGDGSEIYINVDDKEFAITMLNHISSTSVADDLTNVNDIAYEYFEKNNAYKVYLFTDREIENNKNVSVVNIAKQIYNYSVEDVSYSFSTDGEKIELEANGKVKSYGQQATLTVCMYIDGSVESAQEIDVDVDGENSVDFELKAICSDFSELKIAIKQPDCYLEDNQIIIYNTEKNNEFKILIVSDNDFFLKSIFGTVQGASCNVIKPSEYEDEKGKFDLYVYDCFTPTVLPSEGAVWIFNPTSALANTGYSVQERITETLDAKLEYSTSTAYTVAEILNGINREPVSVKSYQKLKLYKSFSILATLNSSPAIFSGVNDNGNRQVVFAFDIHDSDFPLVHEFIVLAHNLINYLFPNEIEQNLFYAGEMLRVNVLSDCKSINVQTPTGKSVWLDISSEAGEMTLTDAGTYSITVNTQSGQKQYNVFARVPLEERCPQSPATSFGIDGEPSNEMKDGYFDDLWYLFVILALLAIADWLVYCYEQYKLR